MNSDIAVRYNLHGVSGTIEAPFRNLGGIHFEANADPLSPFPNDNELKVSDLSCKEKLA